MTLRRKLRTSDKPLEVSFAGDDIVEVESPLSEWFNCLTAANGKASVHDEHVLLSLVETAVTTFEAQYTDLERQLTTTNANIDHHIQQRQRQHQADEDLGLRKRAWKKLRKLRREYGDDTYAKEVAWMEKRVGLMLAQVEHDASLLPPLPSVNDNDDDQDQENDKTEDDTPVNRLQPSPPADAITDAQLDRFCLTLEVFAAHDPEVLMYRFAVVYHGFMAIVAEMYQCVLLVVCDESAEEYSHLVLCLEGSLFMREHVESMAELVCRWVDDLVENVEEIK